MGGAQEEVTKARMRLHRHLQCVKAIGDLLTTQDFRACLIHKYPLPLKISTHLKTHSVQDHTCGHGLYSY